MATPRLLEIRLPPGRVDGFDVNFPGWSGNRQKYVVPEGYDGLRFIGAGRGLTHVVPVAENTILCGKTAGTLSLESLTVHCGARKGIHFGTENPSGPIGRLSLIGRDIEVVADPPPPGSVNRNSTVWGIFTYQAHIDLEDVVFWMEFSAEHAQYAHGYRKPGIRWKNVRVEASGGEGFKCATRPEEVRWVKGTIYLQDCTFKSWYQPWSWRGGAGAVFQGTGGNIVVERCTFYGGRDASHTRCCMVSDGGWRFYNAKDGTTGNGPANGHVVIKQCGMMGGAEAAYAPISRVGTEAPDRPRPLCAQSLIVENSAFYGVNTAIQLAGRDGQTIEGPVTIRGCNTERIAEIAAGVYGFDTSRESMVNHQGYLGPVSAGLTA